jgi:hypothetical protein
MKRISARPAADKAGGTKRTHKPGPVDATALRARARRRARGRFACGSAALRCSTYKSLVCPGQMDLSDMQIARIALVGANIKMRLCRLLRRKEADMKWQTN